LAHSLYSASREPVRIEIAPRTFLIAACACGTRSSGSSPEEAGAFASEVAKEGRMADAADLAAEVRSSAKK
jgi:hypothetical protein